METAGWSLVAVTGSLSDAVVSGGLHLTAAQVVR